MPSSSEAVLAAASFAAGVAAASSCLRGASAAPGGERAPAPADALWGPETPRNPSSESEPAQASRLSTAELTKKLKAAVNVVAAAQAVSDQGDFAWATSAQLVKIVLTGGPGGGKTTSMEKLRTFLSDRGYRVYTIPEAATIFFANGTAFADFEGKEETLIDFQIGILSTQMHMEDTFEMMARATGQPAVLLCDRGAMDGSAYMVRLAATSLATFRPILALFGLIYGLNLGSRRRRGRSCWTRRATPTPRCGRVKMMNFVFKNEELCI